MQHLLTRTLAAIAACLILVVGQAAPSPACTLWAAAGNAAGSGTLLIKNRDNAPDQTDTLLLVRPESGLAYVGLYALIDGQQRLVAGVNEAGLAVVSATAGSVPKALRTGHSLVKGLLHRMLTECKSLEDVEKRKDWFAGHSPVIYMASDRAGVAWVEVGPRGAGVAGESLPAAGNNEGKPADSVVAVRRTSESVLSHTNHYISEQLAGQNTRIGQSSSARLERIQALLEQHQGKAFSLEDFLHMSQDQDAGPDDSIFRTGRTPQSTRTLATFAVRTPVQGAPILDVSGYEVPGQPWHTRLVLDRAFWKHAPAGARLRLAPTSP